jgi:hypothetical protein
MLAPEDSVTAGLRAAQYFERYRLEQELRDGEIRLWVIAGGLLVGLIIALISRAVAARKTSGPESGTDEAR